MERRRFVQAVAGGVAAWAVSPVRLPHVARSSSKPLRGILPIAQTPFAETGALELEGLVEEVRFLHRSIEGRAPPHPGARQAGSARLGQRRAFEKLSADAGVTPAMAG
jgi:hypothetical protein